MGIAAGYVNIDLSWRWYYWVGLLKLRTDGLKPRLTNFPPLLQLYMITGIVTLLLVFFLSAESRFPRPTTYIDGQIVTTDAFGNLHVLSDEEAEKYAATHDIHENQVQTKQDWSLIQRLNPFPAPPTGCFTALLDVYLNIARSLLDPACLWAIGMGGAALGVYVCESLSIATLLEQGYGWSPREVGLYTIAVSVGTILAWPAGILGDHIQLWLAKRNNGLHRPEHHVSP